VQRRAASAATCSVRTARLKQRVVKFFVDFDPEPCAQAPLRPAAEAIAVAAPVLQQQEHAQRRDGEGNLPPADCAVAVA
jgi:hypothetical protein